jgi:hypothetical protein
MDERPILTKLGILTIQLEPSVVHLLSRRPFYQYVIIVTRSLEVGQINCCLGRHAGSYNHHAHRSPSHRGTQAESSDHTKRTIHVAALLALMSAVKRTIHRQRRQPAFLRT